MAGSTGQNMQPFFNFLNGAPGGGGSLILGGDVTAGHRSLAAATGNLHANSLSSSAISDKRSRNPNWTDGEVIRFLEILQEQDTLRDLCAQRNKQVKKEFS